MGHSESNAFSPDLVPAAKASTTRATPDSLLGSLSDALRELSIFRTDEDEHAIEEQVKQG